MKKVKRKGVLFYGNIENIHKKIRLKKWVKYALFALLTILLSIMIYDSTQKEYDKVSKCMAQGYTQNYCEHITGNY